MVDKLEKWDFILNIKWPLDAFDALDIKDFNSTETELANLCRELAKKQIEMNAYNITKEGSIDLCLLYMRIINVIDKFKLSS